MPANRSRLTRRELDVLGHAASGRSNREIGEILSIAEGTVKGHLHRIYRKLHVANRTQAAVAAYRAGGLHRKLEPPAHPPADADR